MTKNLLFITTDQWRGECLSSLGHRVQTPYLDDLAKSGVLFKEHFSNAVPCGPSRALLHTGMYLQNHRSGTNGTPLDARHTNWALEVRKAGYTPALFGYTDTANDPRMFDPDELVNEASNTEYLPLVLEYARKMLSWRMNHDEQLLTHLSLTGDGVISRPSSRYRSD